MKKSFYFLFILPSVLSAAPVITPSTAAVRVGGTLQFASTDTVTWSMTSGSKGSISGTGLYTAPTTYFTPHQILNGCQIFPEDHILNTDISALPIDSSSTARMANLTTVLGGKINIGFDVDMPRNVYSDGTPLQSLVCRFTHNNDGTFPMWGFPDRAEEQSNMPNNYFAQDHHILGISTTSVNGQPECRIYEQYQFYPAGADLSNPLNTDDSCVQYDALSYKLFDVSGSAGGGVDAAGLPVAPLTIKFSELQAGVINHALRFTLDNGNIYSGFLWPAVASTNECASFSGCFPYGSRLRLKSSYIINPNLSKEQKAIYTALKTYGMILADGGTAGHITMEANATDSTTTWTNIWQNSVSSISIQTDMEQVDESSLQVSTASAKVNLANAFVTPSNFAEVVAVKNSDSSSTTVRIALQAPTAGTYNPSFQSNQDTLSVMAGTPQFQIPAYVKGSTDTTSTCSVSPALGSITSDCKYTAPASQYNNVFVTTVTITPTISSVGQIKFPLVVFSSDAIRMKEGPVSGSDTIPPFNSNNDYVDTSTKTWFVEPIGNVPNFFTRDTQGSASWTNSDAGLYYAFDYGSGDKVWSAMVPNGSYQLRLGFGLGSSNSGDVGASTNTLESQGTIFVSSKPLVGATFTPSVFITTVTVTDNRFHWAIRGNDETTHDFISNWSLVLLSTSSAPSASSSRLVILRGQSVLKGKAVLYSQ